MRLKVQIQIVFLFVSLSPQICLGQSTGAGAKPALKQFSTNDLVACFDDFKICHAETWDIVDELKSRGNLTPLFARYWTAHNEFIRSGIERVAYRTDSPEATLFMKRVFAARLSDGENQYYPINYLAKRCDVSALKQLSSGRFRNEGSLQYETSVELFGKCSYRPAIPYLVETAIHDMSFNIIIAAQNSLHRLYPDSPADFKELGQMQQYFCDRAHLEGFKVKCGADD